MIYNINPKGSTNASFNGAAQGTGTTTSGKLKLNTTDIVLRVGYKF